MQKSTHLIYALVAFSIGSVFGAIATSYTLAGAVQASTASTQNIAQAMSASEMQQLKVKVDRLDRALARTQRGLADLERKYSTHTHRLNVGVAAAPNVPSMAVQGPDVKLLFHAGGANPAVTSGPQ